MSKQNILYQGAEAHIILGKYHGKPIIEKKRISKKYRIDEIDQQLITSRTKEEAKLISDARRSGVAVPIIYDVDLQKGVIIMQYLKGKKIKDLLNEFDDIKRGRLCEEIGKNIGLLHKDDIIHGDITTSNMILSDDKVYFIDFGLGCKSHETENKGVDLHVLMEAFESTHSMHPDCFKNVLKGYKKIMGKKSKEVVSKVDDIVKRGRYR